MIPQSQISKLSNRLLKEQGGRRNDLWYLTEQSGSVELGNCLEAINQKLAHRGKKLDDVREEFYKKEARLKKTWETRLSAQMTSLSEFDNVYRAVKRVFRQAKLLMLEPRVCENNSY